MLMKGHVLPPVPAAGGAQHDAHVMLTPASVVFGAVAAGVSDTRRASGTDRTVPHAPSTTAVSGVTTGGVAQLALASMLVAVHCAGSMWTASVVLGKAGPVSPRIGGIVLTLATAAVSPAPRAIKSRSPEYSDFHSGEERTSDALMVGGGVKYGLKVGSRTNSCKGGKTSASDKGI